MKILKKLSVFFVASVIVLVSAFSFVGCDKSKKGAENLSFETISTILTNFNEDLKPFLATLELKYNSSADKDEVKLVSTTLTSLTSGMSTSMKNFHSVFNQYVQTGDESTEITNDKEIISIKTDTSEYIAKLNETETSLSIYTKEGASECLYELCINHDETYLLQVITKNTSGDTYSVYQLKFNGTKGELCIDKTASTFTAIYKAEITESSFPNVSQKIFSN